MSLKNREKRDGLIPKPGRGRASKTMEFNSAAAKEQVAKVRLGDEKGRPPPSPTPRRHDTTLSPSQDPRLPSVAPGCLIWPEFSLPKM